jgi:hypothetical protein
VTCTSFSASENVPAVTSGPTGGAVANAGGAPGVGGGAPVVDGGALGVDGVPLGGTAAVVACFGFSLHARAAPASPSDPRFKKSLRDFAMPLPDNGQI